MSRVIKYIRVTIVALFAEDIRSLLRHACGDFFDPSIVCGEQAH